VSKAGGQAKDPRLSKLETQSSTQRGSAALICGKPPAFRPVPQPPSSSEPAGRLSLPVGSEEVLQDTRPAERRSLSAHPAAEPQVVAKRVEADLDKPGRRPAPTFHRLPSVPLPVGHQLGWVSHSSGLGARFRDFVPQPRDRQGVSATQSMPPRSSLRAPREVHRLIGRSRPASPHYDRLDMVDQTAVSDVSFETHHPTRSPSIGERPTRHRSHNGNG
jgi:hypothetical protein